MAMEIVVQRLQLGDVILVDVPEHGGEVEAPWRASPIGRKGARKVRRYSEAMS